MEMATQKECRCAESRSNVAVQKMNIRERKDVYYRQHWRLPLNLPFCVNCKHFHQHFVQAGPPMFTVSMAPLDSGHCSFPRLKNRMAYDTCQRFENKHSTAKAELR